MTFGKHFKLKNILENFKLIKKFFFKKSYHKYLNFENVTNILVFGNFKLFFCFFRLINTCSRGDVGRIDRRGSLIFYLLLVYFCLTRSEVAI